MTILERERYPIGRFERSSTPLDGPGCSAAIDTIARAPAEIRQLVKNLTDAQLDTPYRTDGWTIRQVVHHVPDSHLNMYTRMKLALTETTPTIKPYDEALWAELPDARSAPVGMSLDLLDALHRRWVTFLRNLSDDQLLRTYRHPELGIVPLFEGIAMYAWHGRHHTAHIRNALERMA
jgi:uncharacterized damage-inducible protein DinB